MNIYSKVLESNESHFMLDDMNRMKFEKVSGNKHDWLGKVSIVCIDEVYLFFICISSRSYTACII